MGADTTRRRALALIAAFAAAPGLARPAVETRRWQGRALGAEASIVLTGPAAVLDRALEAALAEIRAVERLFSLYDPASFLSRLNRAGRGRIEDDRIADLFEVATRLNRVTGGLFDPSIQSDWRGKWRGDATPADPLWQWADVALSADRIALAPGQTLTFNGVAQGYATDRVAERLRSLGATETLIDIGEHRALGGPFHLALDDPDHGHLGQRTLSDGAIATSSPGAMRFADGATHILDPGRRRTPLWSTVSVEAETATLADGLSTALCLASRAEIAALRLTLPDVRRITLVDPRGDLITLS